MTEKYPVRLSWQYSSGGWLVGIISINFMGRGGRMLVGGGLVEDTPEKTQASVANTIDMTKEIR